MVQGRERQRPEHESFETLRRECPPKVEWRCWSLLEAIRNDDSQALRQPLDRELQGTPGRLIHPLRVVDRNDKRIRAAEDR